MLPGASLQLPSVDERGEDVDTSALEIDQLYRTIPYLAARLDREVASTSDARMYELINFVHKWKL